MGVGLFTASQARRMVRGEKDGREREYSVLSPRSGSVVKGGVGGAGVGAARRTTLSTEIGGGGGGAGVKAAPVRLSTVGRASAVGTKSAWR